MSIHYPYLIVGGGMAADAAARGIRQVDSTHPIGLIGQEPDPPYNRPPLSKGLWKRLPRPMPLSRIWRNTASLGVDLHLGRTVVHLDADNKQVIDDQGEVFTFDKLLLATGGHPIRFGQEASGLLATERVIYFRTLADYHRLHTLAENGLQFAVIGGGFIGSEIAAALAGMGKDVTMIFPETGIGARVLPAQISQFLNGYFQERGIRLLTGHMVQSIDVDETGVSIFSGQNELLRVDAVVAGLGIRPNVSLAESAGLATNNGILVDAAMRTTHPDIFAAGDVANFFSPVLGKRMRAEHEENANQTGMLAGLGMAGQPGEYINLPSVYSALFDIHYDAVGELDPRLPVVFDWQEPYQKGTAYYMEADQVRGVLLWNLSRGLDIARQIIADPIPLEAKDLIGRIG
jgi:3-phenylpropionate/trans-cinnamate dioxygenase ferredoxin reductase component